MAPSDRPVGFPYRQMTVLSICRFAEPVAFTSVYPYIPEMVASFHVSTDEIGLYSGWLSAVFSFTQAITGIFWGRASDQLGRKPMILLALFLIMIASVMFGFSTSFAMACVSRAIQGAASGNVGILRTAVAELVPQKELQPRAFSIMPLVWNVGSIFGPSIGGFLSNPQKHGWFLKTELFKKYPYALPNLMISVLFLIGILTGFLFLKETHELRKHRKDYGRIIGLSLTKSCSRRRSPSYRRLSDQDESDPFLNDGDSTTSSPVATRSPWPSRSKPSPAPKWRDMFSRQSSINLIAYSGLAMHSIGFDQLLPVFLHHPLQPLDSPDVNLPFKFASGFGLESGKIGVLFTIYGGFGMVVQFFLFPPLARRFGILNCFKVCAFTFPCVYLAMPFTALLGTDRLRQGFCLALMLVKCAAVIFAFPCSTILLTNSASSLGILGTLNGVATSFSASGRALGPALAGWAFTIGVDHGYAIIPWWLLVFISIMAAIPIWSLVEMEGFSKKSSDNEDDFDSDRESDGGQAEIHMTPTKSQTKVSADSTGLAILSGTEQVHSVNENIPVIVQKSGRPESVSSRRGSNFSSERRLSIIE